MASHAAAVEQHAAAAASHTTKAANSASASTSSQSNKELAGTVLALLLLIAIPFSAAQECKTGFNNQHIQGRDIADMKELDTSACCEACKSDDKCNCFVVDVRLRPNKCYLKQCPEEDLADEKLFKQNLLEEKTGFNAGYVKPQQSGGAGGGFGGGDQSGGAGGGFGGGDGETPEPEVEDKPPCELLGVKVDSVTDTTARLTWNKLSPDVYFLEYYEAGGKFPNQEKISGRQYYEMTKLQLPGTDPRARLFHVTNEDTAMSGPECAVKFDKFKTGTEQQ